MGIVFSNVTLNRIGKLVVPSVTLANVKKHVMVLK